MIKVRPEMLMRKPVTEDLVSYMESAMHYANESFLIEDPQFAVDFAPNGRSSKERDRACLMDFQELSLD